jgi:putative membrane protein
MSEFHPSYLLNAVAYAAVGVLLFILAFLALDRMLPQDLRRQIVEEKNVALAILIGLMSIGVGLIIASAFH